MDIRLTILARRYAQAFLNLFMDQLSMREYQKLQAMSEFIQSHRQTTFFLGLQSIPSHDKEKLLLDLIQKYNLPASLNNLVTTLIHHDRAGLLGKILDQICELYRKKNRILSFNIESSSILEPDQLDFIHKFLAYNTNSTIVSTAKINKELIAGLRLQSDTYLWEYSIRKQINELKRKAAIRGHYGD